MLELEILLKCQACAIPALLLFHAPWVSPSPSFFFPVAAAEAAADFGLQVSVCDSAVSNRSKNGEGGGGGAPPDRHPVRPRPPPVSIATRSSCINYNATSVFITSHSNMYLWHFHFVKQDCLFSADFSTMAPFSSSCGTWSSVGVEALLRVKLPAVCVEQRSSFDPSDIEPTALKMTDISQNTREPLNFQ